MYFHEIVKYFEVALFSGGTAVAQLVEAGSIPDGVIGIFH